MLVHNAFWGSLMAGGVAVAVNTRSSQPEVEFVLQDAGVTRTRSSQAEGSGMGNPPAPGHRDRGDHQ